MQESRCHTFLSVAFFLDLVPIFSGSYFPLFAKSFVSNTATKGYRCHRG